MTKRQLWKLVNKWTNGYFNGKNPEDFYSNKEHWIMFPEKSIMSIAEGKKADLPNIYFQDKEASLLDDEIKWPGWINLTYNNNKAVDWILELKSFANIKQLENIQNILKSLDDKAVTIIHKKTWFGAAQSSPRQIDKEPKKTRNIDVIEIIDRIKALRCECAPGRRAGIQKAPDGKDKIVKRQIPILNLVSYEIEEKQIEEAFRKVWNVFTVCLSQHTGKTRDILNDEIMQKLTAYYQCERAIQFSPVGSSRRKIAEKNISRLREELKALGIDPDSEIIKRQYREQTGNRI